MTDSFTLTEAPFRARCRSQAKWVNSRARRRAALRRCEAAYKKTRRGARRR